jgi:hypothetical protein
MFCGKLSRKIRWLPVVKSFKKVRKIGKDKSFELLLVRRKVVEISVEKEVSDF